MTRQKTKNSPLVQKEKINYQTHNPSLTKRSKGYFYIRPYSSGNWGLYFESWSDGRKKQEPMPESFYLSCGLTSDMTLEQARKAIKDYNKFRKKDSKNTITRSQIHALKRLTEIQEFNKMLFPEDVVRSFLEKKLPTVDSW